MEGLDPLRDETILFVSVYVDSVQPIFDTCVIQSQFLT